MLEANGLRCACAEKPIDLCVQLERELTAVTAEQGVTQEVLRVTKNALERLTAERDAEREARKALEQYVRSATPDLQEATRMRESALALAAKLP
jgi:hypothetical protein